MSCSCGQSNCQCNTSPCAPANVIYQSACTDPGVVNSGSYLEVLDSQFCRRRLVNAAGTLVSRQNGSGNWEQVFTNQPIISLDPFQAVTGQTFGDFVVEGSDGILRYLLAPATAGLVPTTLANGDVVWAVPPSPTVPDPLTITTLNATNVNTTNEVVTGNAQFTGLATGTPTFTLGLDGSNNLIKQTPISTGTQSVMFFESPTSPSASTPNAGTHAGAMLVIGNEINSSTTVGALISVTTSQLLTVVQAGFYIFNYECQITIDGATQATPSIAFLVNGVAVSNGNSRTGVRVQTIGLTVSSSYQRRMVAGDTIQLQFANGSGGGTATHIYEARLVATRIGA